MTAARSRPPAEEQHARLREQLRRAAEDGERLYRVRMHEDAGPTIAADNRIDGILTRELETALGFVDALLAALADATRERDEETKFSSRVMAERDREIEKAIVAEARADALAAELAEARANVNRVARFAWAFFLRSTSGPEDRIERAEAARDQLHDTLAGEWLDTLAALASREGGNGG